MKAKRSVLSAVAVSACAGLLAVSAVAVEGGGPRSAPGRRPEACRSVHATGIPSWVTTGAEVDGRFLVVDVNERRLVEISRSGVAGELRSALGDYVAGRDITRVRQGGKTGTTPPPVVLEFASGNLLDIDRSLTPRRKAEMTTAGLRSGDRQIAMLLDWIVTGDGREVVGYADLTTSGLSDRSGWLNGFVRFPLDNPSSFRVVGESLFPGDQRTMMMLTYPLLASLGSTAFVVNQDGNQLGLWRFGASDTVAHPMRAFPEHLKGELAPMLPSFVRPEEYVRTMHAAETATMPVGLYAWDDALFILSREYRQGQRRWFLSRIDPVRDALLWSVQVPGSAPHMMAIPGETDWAFLAKGPVLGVQNQVTQQILFVSSKGLRGKDRSLQSLCH